MNNSIIKKQINHFVRVQHTVKEDKEDLRYSMIFPVIRHRQNYFHCGHFKGDKQLISSLMSIFIWYPLTFYSKA